VLPLKDNSSPRGFVPGTVTVLLVAFVAYALNARLSGGLLPLCAARPADIVRYLVEGTGSFFAIQARILASAFLHAGLFHLAVNLVFLSVFAPAVERTIGFVRFSLFYVAAVFCAFYAHVVITPHSVLPVVGASGAIAAVMGMYLILYPRGRVVTLLPLIPSLELVELPSFVFILVWFALQTLFVILGSPQTSHVAWFSHIGGFAFGIVSGVNYRLSRTRRAVSTM